MQWDGEVGAVSSAPATGPALVHFMAPLPELETDHPTARWLQTPLRSDIEAFL